MAGEEPSAPRELRPEGLTDPRAPWEELIEDPSAPRAMLAVMFTDIVGSTELATALGDKRWRELLERHDAAIREQIARFDGREVDTAGDSFFATFGLAVRTVDCALECARAVRRLGLRIRAGIHMGECVVYDGKVRGVTVHIGARVGAKARGDEVLVSSTVRDILAGAGLKFAERGEQTLKGVEGRWRLYAVEPRVRDNEADLPPLLEAEIAGPPKPAWRKPRALAAIGTALAVLIGAIAFVTFRGPGGLSSVPADSVAVINASSGAVESSIAVRRRPVGLATAPDGVWVANSIDRSITRIRPGGQTDTIPVGPGPIAMTAGGDFMWVVNGDASNVSRVSRTTQSVVGDPIQAGNGLTSIAYQEGPQPGVGDDSLWLANSVDGSVWRVSPTTGARTLTVQVGPDLRAIAVTKDAVWAVSERAGTVSRIDPKTGVIVRVVNVGNGPVALAIAGRTAWVVNAGDSTVTRIDTTTYATKDYPVGRGARAVAIADGKVFVANEDAQTVSLLDSGGGLIRTIELGNAPMGLIAQGDQVWVSVRGGTLRYKGGTLRFGGSVLPDTLDPTVTFEPVVFTSIVPAVYDGLTAFKRVGGPEGNQLVPNLAEEIRPPTNNGHTYTYTLKKDLKYSDGTPVRASDVRKTFERIIRNEAYGATFAVIVKGAETCTRSACDLSAGIVTNDDNGSIVFNLRSAYADFPYQLALPSLSILPGNTPTENQGMKPIAGTGPYRITTAKLTPGAPAGAPGRAQVVLERNTHFVPRGPAQPDGYPDRIEFDLGGTPEEHIRAVIAGRTDATFEFEASGPLGADALATELPAQFRLFDMPWNAFVSLNTQLPPFNNVDARRALSYALDRQRMARATDGLLGDISCQLLPKNTVGYTPYCPYTKDPGPTHVWKGPDLAKARQLVERSGTAGQQVTVWTQRGESFSAFQRAKRAPIVVETLNAIGYEARMREWPGDYHEGLNDPNGMQVGLTGWISDYPAASNFVLPLITCPATLERLGLQTLFTANITHFCDAEVDAATEAALKAQQEDPGASRDAWAKVDKLIADKAPYVIVANLRSAALFSARVGNAQGHATYLLLLTQMWVTEPGSPSPSPGG